MAFDPLSFIIGQQTAKGSGGGSVEGVHFVTFMSEDGTTELYKRAVVDGDDCADPVKRGYISEPVKESTAQYNYTLVGWSATPNGALDENILKAVTADKTVYANFAAVLRYYTVTYYDDDGTTVLKTESLAYGTMPSYVPTKDGHDFVEWTPKEAVSGEMSYTAVWKVKATFGTATWAEINAAVSDGTYRELYNLGDTRTVTITYSDGTKEDVIFEIVDMDTSNSDSTSSFANDAKLVLMATHLLAKPRTFNDTNKNGNGLYYMFSTVLTYLKDELSGCFPADMQTVMKSVSMPYANGASKVHIPTTEMLGKKYDYSSGQNDQANANKALERFPSGTSLICKTADGTAQNWWTSTVTQVTANAKTRPIYVTTSGRLSSGIETESYYIRPIVFI